jgi:ribosome maturation factor RimP
MQRTELIERLTEALQPEAAARGLELVAVEQAGGRGMPVLRVLLDSDEGIDLDAIASANAWVSAIIDEAEPFSHPYTLEVSSPGIDRPLTKRGDFTRFVGQTITIKAKGAEKRTSWTGELLGMEGDDVILAVDGRRAAIAYDTISKARLKGVVDFGRRKEQSA